MPKIPKVISSVDASSLGFLAELLRDATADKKGTRRRATENLGRMRAAVESAVIAEKIAGEMCRLRGVARRKPAPKYIRVAAQAVLDWAGPTIGS